MYSSSGNHEYLKNLEHFDKKKKTVIILKLW